MQPEFSGGENVKAFVRGMGAFDGWAKGDHVEVWVFFEEETAFQSGVDRAHNGFCPEPFLIGLHSSFQDF